MSIVRIFDTYADRYDSWYSRNRIIAENEVHLLKSIGIEHPCIEVGVGTGFFAKSIGIDIGLEPSLSMALKAWKRGVDVVIGFGELIPIKSNSMSMVFMIVTLCFLEKPIDVVKECIRILKRGGRLVSCIIPRDSSWGKYYQELGEKGHPLYSIAKLYTVDEMNMLFEGLGLNRVRALGTLSFKPWEEPRYEDPIEWNRDRDLGFVCVEYRKI